MVRVGSSDVVVIGGGIAGAATCYYLASAGISVTLLDRAEPATGASGSNQGNVNFRSRIGTTLEELSELSRTLYQGLESAVDTDAFCHRTGGLVLCETEQQAQEAQIQLETIGGRGPRAEYLSADALRRKLPFLAPDIAGGVFCPTDFQVNPMRFVSCLVVAARAAGARILPFAEVTAIHLSGPRGMGVRIGEEFRPAGAIALTAGAWSGPLAATAGIGLAVLPRRGQILVTEPMAPLHMPFLIESAYKRVATHAGQSGSPTGPPTTQIAFVGCQREKGNFLIGSSSEYVGFENRVTSPVMGGLFRRARRFLPWLGRLTCIRVFSGLRPSTPDALPLLGRVQSSQGTLFVATGHEGSGMNLGLASGKVIADLIRGGDPPIDLNPFAPGRFGGTRG